MNLVKIDELIATEVMRWNKHLHKPSGSHVWVDKNDMLCEIADSFKPAKNISDAWIVIEKLKENRWIEISISKLGAPLVDIGEYSVPHSTVQTEAETVPMAICLAALETVGILLELK